MVFEGLRQSFEDLLNRAIRPEERSAVASRMKETLVQARMGVDDLRTGLDKTRQRLVAEERELETVRRRKALAEQINDRETIEIATKYEEMHAQRVDVVRRKVEAQEAELSLAERDVGEMTAQLKAVMSGAGGATTGAIDPGLSSEEPADASNLRDEIDSLRRSRAAADREADAAKRLDELKRRMGK